MSKFQKIEFYRSPKSTYTLLPFRWTLLDRDTYVLTNMAGEYLLSDRATVHRLARHELRNDEAAYVALRARHFLVDANTSIAPELLAIKLRTKYQRLAEFTGLHILVVTLRCEHSCPYCQVSRQSDDKLKFDMSEEMALGAIDLILKSPARNIKIEFQGGEPLLNFPLIRFTVLEVKKRAVVAENKSVVFVIATNLALVSDDILAFCREHSIQISTSLDGPRDLHNKNRPRPGRDSYERAIAGIAQARKWLGDDQVSALMTTTSGSLDRPEEIVDEYLAQGFKGIFLRPLAPYGFAVKTKSYHRYDARRWLQFYNRALEYIVRLNRNGTDFQEFYSATILKKMLTSDDPGYVDLMSPSGIGIGAVVYNYDGYVYASDESRMLAEMGCEEFKIGKIGESSYSDIFTSPNLLRALEESFSFSAPMCNDCAFEPYCGADPVFHFGTQGDYLGRKPESEFCTRHMEMCRILIGRMEKDRFEKHLFTKWANS